MKIKFSPPKVGGEIGKYNYFSGEKYRVRNYELAMTTKKDK